MPLIIVVDDALVSAAEVEKIMDELSARQIKPFWLHVHSQADGGCPAIDLVDFSADPPEFQPALWEYGEAVDVLSALRPDFRPLRHYMDSETVHDINTVLAD